MNPSVSRMQPDSAVESFRRVKPPSRVFFHGIIFLRLVLTAFLLSYGGAAFAQGPEPSPKNATCLSCHNIPGFAIPGANGEMRQLHVSAEEFGKSVHGVQACVNCHKDITGVPHEKGVDRQVGCVECHRNLWDEAKLGGTTEEHSRLGKVVEQIESYMGSIHARPSMADQGRTNATCYNCHDAHYISPIDGDKPDRVTRMGVPEVCGQCHEDVRDSYRTSVHGIENSKGNSAAAVCIDCHTPHHIDSPKIDSNKLAITQQCGNCHQESLASYMGTYHGQVNTLGFAFTAKCFDCHGSHEIKRVDDEASTMHINNRLETCQTCHEDATEGYRSFQPHGTSHDFEKYPRCGWPRNS